jgi:hypothetical protein
MVGAANDVPSIRFCVEHRWTLDGCPIGESYPVSIVKIFGRWRRSGVFSALG